MLLLKEFRIKNGFSQSYIAKKLHCTRMTIFRWEICKTYPNSEQIKKLAEILNTTPNELLGVEDKKNSTENKNQ